MGPVSLLCAHPRHTKNFVEKNLATWLKEKKIVPGTALAKPQQLTQYELKRNRNANPPPKAPPAVPSPKASSPAPSATASPPGSANAGNSGSPAPSGSNGGAANGAPGRNLLASCGNVAM